MKYPTRHYSLLLATRLALACLGGATLSSMAYAAPSAEQAYQLPAGSLSAQLKQFSQQSGIKLNIDESLVKGWTRPALNGRYSGQQGLNAILADTGLQAVANGEGYQLIANTAYLAPVTVTGEKINRSMQETTTAITVLNGADLDKGHVTSIYEVGNRAPNVNINGAGGINIRGVEGTGPATGIFSFISGARPRVSTSVDGAPETWSGQQYVDFGMWDVEQVEILRGPQSTTQGRNTIGGAVVVNTKNPTSSWEGAVRAGYENEAGRTLGAAMISGPIVQDELAFRLAAEGIKGKGFVEYPGDWPWDPSDFKRQNIRAKLLWTPSNMPDFSAKLTVSQRDQEGEFLNRINSANHSDRTYSKLNSRVNTRTQDSSKTTANIDLEYKISEALNSHLLYSRGKYRASFKETGADRFQLQMDENSNTLESRLVYDPQGGSVTALAGLYYYDRHQDLSASPYSAGFFGTDKVDTLAFFGESTIALNSSFDLNIGGRIERESQKRNVLGWPSTPNEALIKTDITETMFLPKIGVIYKATPETSFGLTYREGYTPGAGSINYDDNKFYEYGKEEVSTIELSSRSSFLDKRLALNANLFYNRYKDYQALLNNYFTNIPKAESYGVEVSADASVNSSLKLFASLGLLSTKITESNTRSTSVEGNRFGYAAPVSASFGFKQQFDAGFFVNGDISHTGEYYSDLNNSETLKAGDYTLANLQVGYDKGNYAVRAYIKNLFNSDVIYRKGSRNNEADAGAPRTVGVTVDYRF
ncbi:TonB-dependent receptor domain-containing protein [Iodobacter arcticus]|uniref:TonB-dependent receptor domain-containing protein n=1 Tax=Iodobacter arcticus TaxID=590593 RepID=A0ABW2QYP1_9NEIS